jgi:hypothetical protein
MYKIICEQISEIWWCESFTKEGCVLLQFYEYF